MKTVIIGSNHAGIAAANTLLDNYPGTEVVLIDRNTNLSYLGCGTALWVGRQIDGYEDLFYTNEETFRKKGAKIFMESSVTSIDFNNKIVYFENKAGEKSEESYDKLILATGSKPIIPNIPGKDLEGLHFLKLFQEGQEVDHDMSREDVKTVAVIGAGYIGVEIAEAAKRRGKNVLLFDAMDFSFLAVICGVLIILIGAVPLIRIKMQAARAADGHDRRRRVYFIADPKSDRRGNRYLRYLDYSACD